MQKIISLQEIIESVLNDKGVEYEKMNDSTVRSLRRAFDKLIERLGSDKETLKHGGRTIEFDELDIPFMKVLVSKLYENSGLIADFTHERNKNKPFSSMDVHKLIQSLIDEAAKTGMNENELMQMARFFCSIFFDSPLRSIENCHALINTLASCIQDLTSDQQARYLGKVEHILQKECFLRSTESIIAIKELAELIEISKALADDDIGLQNYYEQDPEIRFEYIQRDQRVLEIIQEDDDLRQYIEKTFKRKAEEIFNYASLDYQSK